MRGARILGPVPGPGKSEDASAEGALVQIKNYAGDAICRWKPGLVGDVLLREARLALCREVDRR
jgi:hypothetical protein